MKTLIRGTEKALAGWVVAKLIFAEQARSDRGTTLGTWNVGIDAGFLAGLDIFDFKIASVGLDRDPLHPENLFCRFGGLGQQTHVHNLVGDLLLDDQLVLAVDSDLHEPGGPSPLARRGRTPPPRGPA